MRASVITEKDAIEAGTRFVYGQTFARYSKREFLEFLSPLAMRLKKNGIPASVFEGKTCLDAGCGGGRGSILMARAGARQVLSYDLSEQNVDTTAARAREFGLRNIKTMTGTLLDIPLDDESVDIVWCNGVLHHTVDTDRSLREVCRVLRRGGWMWLYLYGSGGLYWYMVDFLRGWLAAQNPASTIAILAAAGVPTGHIAAFIDDWHVPVLRRYTDDDVAERLRELGFADVRLLDGGTTYDTSVRRHRTDESKWMGEGDLRYWVQKTHAQSPATGHLLPDVNEIGSLYKDSPEVESFTEQFEQLKSVVADIEIVLPEVVPTIRALTAARLHGKLRDDYSRETGFDGEEFRAWMTALTRDLERFIVK
jgi:ubiquinone/menaquinone biosynthesis C-methylase UbiE